MCHKFSLILTCPIGHTATCMKRHLHSKKAQLPDTTHTSQAHVFRLEKHVARRASQPAMAFLPRIPQVHLPPALVRAVHFAWQQLPARMSTSHKEVSVICTRDSTHSSTVRQVTTT